MISILSVDRVQQEQQLLRASCSDQIAHRSDEQMEFFSVMDGLKEPSSLPKGQIMDILYYELEAPEDLEPLRQMRKEQREALLVLLTKPTLSPMLYLKPAISPSLLMQRPLDGEIVQKTNQELFDALFENRTEETEEVFSFKCREGLVRVRIRDIHFFEARNKKINLRVGNEEYEFYDSIEHIAQQLPPYFVRCHRAYLVNIHQIRQVRLSENLVELYSATCLPLSRTYRQNVKDQIK